MPIQLNVDRVSLAHEHVNCPIIGGKFRLPGRYRKYPTVHLWVCYPLPTARQYWIDVEHVPGCVGRWVSVDMIEEGMLLEIAGRGRVKRGLVKRVQRYYQVVVKTDEIVALKRYRKGQIPFCMKCGHRHVGVVPQILELATGERVYFKRRIRKKTSVDRWVYGKRFGKIAYTRAPGANYVIKSHKGYWSVSIVKGWNEAEELEAIVLEGKTFFLSRCTSSTELRLRLQKRRFTEDQISRATEIEDWLRAHKTGRR